MRTSLAILPRQSPRLILLAMGIMLGAWHATAQPGANDPTFNPGDHFIGQVEVNGVNGSLWAIVPQADGKTIIGGQFTSYKGTPRNGIARLNADGTLDTSFNPGTGTAGGQVRSITVQADGKIIIGGNFFSYNGTGRNLIARLNTDGTLDATFNPGTGANNLFIHSTVLQADGRIIIGGNFTTYNGTARNRIARLNADGSLDASFDPGTGANTEIQSIALQPDGKIIIGGIFSTYNGTARTSIARLNADGGLDTAFDPGTGVMRDATIGTVPTITLQADGRIIIGGRFTSYNGTARNGIARLNADGSLDASFGPGTGVMGGTVQSIALQADGKALIGGLFSSYNGTARNNVARLNSDGSLDTGFDPGTGADGTIEFLTVQADGRTIIGGGFFRYDARPRRGIARLNADGSLDAAFNPLMGAGDIVLSTALQADGRIIIGGIFTTYNDTVRSRIARLNTDGTLDTSFDPGTGPNERIDAIAVQADGKIIIGGPFTTYNGTGCNRIAQLNTDGSLDTSFDPGSGINGLIFSIALQPNGKILIGGDFTTYNGTGRNRIARLNTDGTLDPSFNPGSGASGSVSAIALQADGKIIIGGSFTSYNGTGRNRIARLNADGSLDTGFGPGTGANNAIQSIALHPPDAGPGLAGKIIIRGSFTSYNGTGRNRIARLNADGSLDTGFDPGTGPNNAIQSIALQSNGKVLIGGSFTMYNGTARNRIARLNADGSIDTGFDPGTGANDAIVSIRVQADGKIIIGGLFTTYNDVSCKRVARVFGDALPDCHGDLGGTASVDDCGACSGGNTGVAPNSTCTQDCHGDWGGTAHLDACNNCVGGNTGLTPCAPTCPHDLFLVYDVGANNGDIVAWGVYQAGTNTLVQSGTLPQNAGPVTINGSMPICLPNGSFYLRVTDSGGDGMAGGYRLITADGRRIIDNTGNFLSGDTSAIANDGSFELPMGTDQPIYTSCDKLWWRSGDHIVANENPAVSAVWVDGGANNQQSANSGYEFWWYDPNGGYSFRKLRTHHVSEGYASIGATRACHQKLDNWAAANHLPQNRPLNVRVRGWVNGVPVANWGPACRFGINASLAACPPTKLMDIPGDPDFSCGVVRSLARGQRVLARPVRGANAYQWRFRIPAEGFSQVVSTTTYILNTGTVPGLANGKTYNVEVRASMNGGATWCGTAEPWGDVCLLTIAQPMQGDNEQGIVDAGSGFRLWPNPNRGDQLWLSIPVIPSGAKEVTVDVHDLSGKRVATRTIAVLSGPMPIGPERSRGGEGQGDHLNTMVDLGAIAGGMYIVQVTAGDRLYTERLVIQP